MAAQEEEGQEVIPEEDDRLYWYHYLLIAVCVYIALLGAHMVLEVDFYPGQFEASRKFRGLGLIAMTAFALWACYPRAGKL